MTSVAACSPRCWELVTPGQHGLALQGCGKTIEMLALILSNPAPAKGASADRLIRSRWDALL